MPTPKQRLDLLLVTRGLAESRAQAQALIMAGNVLVGGQPALKAGMAFSNTKTALAHSISYEMTLRYGLPHGIACSFLLPMVLERAIGRRADRDAVLREALGMPLAEAPRQLAAFIESLGVKTRFADYGVGDDEAREMLLHAQGGARGKNFIGNDLASNPT